MSLWVDKYRPTSLCKVDYHREQAAQLRNLVRGGGVWALSYLGSKEEENLHLVAFYASPSAFLFAPSPFLKLL